ncbi:hypothetical protein [Luteolibacter luteus]|uniref:Uncharacterized protein n=1 Tax=Luteolibacter luteus TaxID=2728835 RepID=A0A858RD39_9BACT|nr:hypothetical protein [Luteolibacter luteus]QJE94309.1 hypothetical protein HHL09_00415 [Luteolibacter luteus]
METSSKRITILRSGIALGVFALSGWLGYAFVPEAAGVSGERPMKAGAGDSPGMSRAKRGFLSAKEGSPADESPEARARRVAEVKQKLKDLWRASPSSGLNWDLDQETHRMLATLAPEELEAFFKELPNTGTGLPAHFMLRLEVLKAWAVKDGPAAIERCVSGGRMDFFCRSLAIGAWGEADAEAALAWLKRDDLPESVVKHRQMMLSNLVSNLSRSDFDRAAKELSMLSEGDRDSMISRLVSEGFEQGAVIDGLLEMARRGVPEGKVSEADEEILSTEARRDPEAAVARLAALENIDAGERARLDLVILNSETDKGKAFQDWLARNPDLESIPEAAWSTLSIAITSDAGKVAEWLGKMPEGGFRDEFYERAIRGFASLRNFDDAVHFSSRISDPAIRADALRALDAVWKSTDAGAAGEWRKSLPKADREALGE